MLADTKAQPSAAELPRQGVVNLIERLKESFDLFFVHADARVGYIEA